MCVFSILLSRVQDSVEKQEPPPCTLTEQMQSYVQLEQERDYKALCHLSVSQKNFAIVSDDSLSKFWHEQK